MITGPRDTIKRARRLRSEMSLTETLLWRELRKRPGGFKFRRQHGAGNYVIDFYCASARLAIEVDGRVHDNAARASSDAAKSLFLRSQGVATVRVSAKAVLEDPVAAAVRLGQICAERVATPGEKPDVPLHHASHGPPPRSGEDR